MTTPAEATGSPDAPPATNTPTPPGTDVPAAPEVVRTTTGSIAAAPVMSQRQIRLVMVGLMAGMFLAALDQTIVGTAIRTIGDDLNGLSLQAWATTAYLITSTISTPIYGKLSDIFGRRPLFMFSIVTFLVGSLAASFSQSMLELAAFRAIQGMGAGGLMSMPLAIMGDILAPRERAKYQGYFIAVFGLSSVIGPLIGGLFAGTPQILWVSGWRWVFLVNVPVGIAALIMVVLFLHLPRLHARRVRIDWWGAAAVILTLVPLLIVVEEGREWGWASGTALICYALGAVGAAAFLIVESRMGDDALIPFKIFRNSTFSMATVIGLLVGFAMFGAMMTIPLILQLVYGSTPTESGLQLIPVVLGMMGSSITTGQVTSRTGKYRLFPILGTLFLIGGYLVLTQLQASSSYWYLALGMFLVGGGLGQLMQTLMIASQNSVGPRDIGVATSSATFFRQIGGTLGTAILISTLFAILPTTITQSLSQTNTLTSALDAALTPQVARDPKNAAIMHALYDGVVSKFTPTLPAGIDLSNDTQRRAVVTKLVPEVQKVLQQQPPGSHATSSGALNDTSFLTTADPRLAAPFKIGFVDGATQIYWIGFAVTVLAFLLSLFFKTPPLRKTSALQETANARARAADAEAHAAAAG